MANVVTNTANIQLIVTEDATQNVLLSRIVSPSLDVEFSQGLFYETSVATSGHLLRTPFNLTAAKHFYIRNTSQNGTLLIVYTLVGGATAIPALVLGPGDMFLYWQAGTGAPVVNGLSQGINLIQGLADLAVYSNVPGITYEYFVGN